VSSAASSTTTAAPAAGTMPVTRPAGLPTSSTITIPISAASMPPRENVK
jgi:hypothetical protein